MNGERELTSYPVQSRLDCHVIHYTHHIGLGEREKRGGVDSATFLI